MMYSSGISSLYCLTFLLSLCHAYQIADDCTNFSDEISDAINEAVDIANYAAVRWQHTPVPRNGTLLQDMLGAPDEDDVNTLQFAATWFSRAADTSSLVIHCSDTYLNRINNGFYRDPTNGNAQVSTGQNPTACGGALRAFAYPAGTLNVIVLCSDSANGALGGTVHPTFANWRDGGNLLITPAAGALGIDFFAQYLSYKFLHEMMHCANFQQFPAQLPSGIGERYAFQGITGHAPGGAVGGGPGANDRQHNADSMALLGCGWFLPSYFWTNGQVRVERRRLWLQLNY